MDSQHNPIKIGSRFEEENIISRYVSYAIARRCKDVMVSKDTLQRIQTLFLSELDDVLSKATTAEKNIHCYKTPMVALPTGDEKAKVLAMHYSGDFVQVTCMSAFDSTVFDMIVEVYGIPSRFAEGTLKGVLSFAAECTEQFLRKYELMDDLPMAMGVGVNLPLLYDDRKVFLAKPTDQFNTPESLQQDMVQVLESALEDLGLDVDIVGFVSSGTGSLLSNYWRDSRCKVGLLTAYGTTLCYIEDAENAKFPNKPKDAKYALIELDNGEFGINGELDFMKSEPDIQLEGLTPNKQVFEKMVSSKYIGELVRLKISQLVEEKLMLKGIGSSRLSVPYNFRREFVILIANDDDKKFVQTKKVAEDLDLAHASKYDLAVIKFVVKLYLTRSARMIAAVASALIAKLAVTEVLVSIEGTLLHFNPFYEYKIRHALEVLVDKDVKVNLIMSENGPAKGAALIAVLVVSKKN